MTETLPRIDKPSSAPPLRGQKLDALTGLRFFAALHVLAFHCWVWKDWNGPAHDLTGAGYIGVGLFFVLSGFILAYNYLGKAAETKPKAFYQARFARIYPVYALALLFAAPMFIRQEGVHLVPLYGGLRFTLLQAWFPTLALKWNTPSWSLSVEALFYLLFPLLLLPFSRLSTRNAKWTLGLMLLLALVPASIYVATMPPADSLTENPWIEAVKFFPLARLPEFIAGICVAKIFMARKGKASGPVADAVTLAALGSIFLAIEIAPYPLIHTGLLVLPFCAIIWAQASGAGLLARFLSLPFMVLLGEASYALYIFHVPLHEYYLHLTDRLDRFVAVPGTVKELAFIVIAVLLSILVLKKFEEPWRKKLRPDSSRKPQKLAIEAPALAQPEPAD